MVSDRMALEISSDMDLILGGNMIDLTRNKLKKVGRPAKVRKTKSLPKLVLGPRPTSEDCARLLIWTNEEIRNNALELLNEVEGIRKKSVNINGGLSGKMRTRVQFLKSVVNTLTDRAEDQGSLLYNRVKNEELERQIKTLERMVGDLKEDLKKYEERNRDLRARIKSFEERIGSLSLLFEGEPSNREGRDNPGFIKKSGRRAKTNGTKESSPRNDTISEYMDILKMYDE